MLHRPRRSHALFALALATLAAACGSDSSTAPNVQPVTLDQALAELSGPALSATAASFDVGPALPALVASRCAYESSSQSFACTPLVANGLTVTQGFTLLDAAGAKQAAFDKASTSAVRANTTVAGTLQQGQLQLAVDGEQELTLTGLRTATHTLDGTSRVHVASISGSGLPFETTVNTTITGLKLPAPTADGTRPWPTAGTIVVETSNSIGGAPPAVIRATITFSGTSKVAVTLTGPGVSATCTIDLASQAPSCS